MHVCPVSADRGDRRSTSERLVIFLPSQHQTTMIEAAANGAQYQQSGLLGNPDAILVG